VSKPSFCVNECTHAVVNRFADGKQTQKFTFLTQNMFISAIKGRAHMATSFCLPLHKHVYVKEIGAAYMGKVYVR